MNQFDIVAIGASAGGLKALSEVLSGLPADLPVPILIVEHLDPRHKSLMAEILQRHCKMKVKEAEHFGMPQSAIATGAVDFILPLQDIAPAISALVRGEQEIR